MLVTLEVSKSLRLRLVRLEHWWNMPAMVLTLEVLRFDKFSMLVSLDIPKNQ